MILHGITCVFPDLFALLERLSVSVFFFLVSKKGYTHYVSLRVAQCAQLRFLFYDPLHGIRCRPILFVLPSVNVGICASSDKLRLIEVFNASYQFFIFHEKGQCFDAFRFSSLFCVEFSDDIIGNSSKRFLES